MTPLAALTPKTDLLDPTGRGRARAFDLYTGLRGEGYAVDAVLVVKEQGKGEESYGVEEFAANGGRAFYVRKPFGAGCYTVFCGRVSESCDCAGGSYRGRCKHLSSIRAAIKNQWL